MPNFHPPLLEIKDTNPRKTLKVGLPDYEGKDKDGQVVKISRAVDVAHDRREITEEMSRRYGGFFDTKRLPGRMVAAQLDREMELTLPRVVVAHVETILDQAAELSASGKGERFEYPMNALRSGAKLPPFRDGLRRALVMSYVHSRDVEILMDAFGLLKRQNQFYGVHDVHEFISARQAKTKLTQSDPWYVDYIQSFADDDPVDVGFFNPRLSAIVFKYGFDKNAGQNGLDGHRLTAHHLGNPEVPIDWVERAVNFVYHHLPREHFGILQRPQRDWEALEDEIATSRVSRFDPVLHDIVRDSAELIRLFEEAGLITPWNRLDLEREPRTPGGEIVVPVRKPPLPSEKQLLPVLRQREFEGIVEIDPATNTWSVSGGPGWRLGMTNESDPATCEILLSEPLMLGYAVQVTPLSRGATLVRDYEIAGIREDRFRVFLDTVGEQLRGPVGFSFFVRGLAKVLTPDDRFIPTSQLVEDANGIGNLFRNDAEFGVVTVMASASLRSKEAAENDVVTRQKELAETEAALADPALVSPAIRAELERDRIRRTNKLERARNIVGGARYWESAKRFGEMWGRYVAVDQSADLGGRSVPVCTGGGPGIMAAVAQGSSSFAINGTREARAPVVAIDTIFEGDEKFNLTNDPGVFSNVRLRCNDFSLREMALINFAHVILFWPGGYGTMWEAFETLSKLQTRHLRRSRVKAIFVHTEFWKPLVELSAHFRAMGTVNTYDDRILLPGDSDAATMSHEEILANYIAEVVDNEHDAFEKARAHLRFLFARNDLYILR